MKKIRLAIVDDHKLIREMWVIMFSGSEEIEIVGDCGEFDDAIAMIKQQQPDVVLLDINLEKASGMDAVPLIQEHSPATRIVAVSMHNQPTYAKKMLQLGAMAYVTKNSSYKEIFKAIDEVLNGRIYICEEIRPVLPAADLNDTQSTDPAI